MTINKRNWIEGIRIRETDPVVFYFDDQNAQLIIQSPPLMGHIFYIPYKKIESILHGHARELGKRGGEATKAKLGKDHFKKISKLGVKARNEKLV